jgi:hypothetical protein
MDVWPRFVSSERERRNKSPGHETILGFWRRTPETPDGYQLRNKHGAKRLQGKLETVKMRTMSFIFAFALLMAGSSMAGSAETDLPGIGTFSYNGSTVATSAPHTLVVAAR